LGNKIFHDNCIPKKVSPGVTGEFELTMGHLGTTVLDVQFSDWEFKTAMQNDFGLDLKTVSKHGDCNTGFKFIYESNTCDDFPDVTLENTGLSRPELVPEYYKFRDGGIWLKTIPGNYLRQRVETPQIVVHDSITNIPASCAGDCGFEFTSDNLPVIASVSPAEFNGGSLTITGLANFELINSVVLGDPILGVPCEIVSHIDLVIECSPTSLSLPGGAVPVFVNGESGNSLPSARIKN
jgi:hypothetical protein